VALLQISEPGKSTLPHEHRNAIGIDLGTTHSLVAAVQSGEAKILQDEKNARLIPSIVNYHKEGVLVGNEAARELANDPTNTITSAKRLIGKKLSDIQSDTIPLKLINQDQLIGIETNQGIKTPIEVSSEILKKLSAIAQNHIQDEIFGAVITVPAYFDDAQRQATKDAARLAGLHVLRLINEPTAAALAYGLDKKVEGRFVIYDLGGGTFDISILQLSHGLFEVIATQGDTGLGGDDYDLALFNWLISDLDIKVEDPKIKQALISLSKKIKEGLSQDDQIEINEKISDEIIIKKIITQAEFSELTDNLTQKTLKAIKAALHDANSSIDDIDGVVMVGGSTRMPVIQKAVQDFFKKELLNDINPDEVVALGAAQQANILAGNTNENLLLLDVTPLSLGIETMGEIVEKIIPRNSTLPIAMAQEFTTYKDGQTAMMIHVVQGEREMVKDCRSLAKFSLKGIPPMVAGAAKIRVTFQVDTDGLLSVTAKELSTNTQASIEVKPSYGLDDEQIRSMLEDSLKSANKDLEHRALAEEKMGGHQLLEMLKNALAEDQKLIDKDEIKPIDDAVKGLEMALQGDDRHQIHEKIERLNDVTQNFAQARMDHSIQKALSGKTLKDMEL
jgi:molecular chaperone HscA